MERPSDLANCTVRARDRCRNTSTRRFMDARCGDAGGGPRAVEAVLATWRSVDPYLVGNPRCRPGTAWTWRLVSRCSPVRLEAHQPSHSEELVSTPLKRVFPGSTELFKHPDIVGTGLVLGFRQRGIGSTMCDKNETIESSTSEELIWQA